MSHKIYCAFETNLLNGILASICDCIADIRYWMITKWKINKTEFLLITSPSAILTRDIQIAVGKGSNIIFTFLQESWGHA